MTKGDVIGERYELREILGSGGMAEVWLAHDPRLQRPVAVKFLAPHFADRPDYLVRFFNEAQAIARIQHPNVVTILDFGEVEGRPFLVMERVRGGDLTDLIGEPVPPEQALQLVGKAAAGAGAAHALHIVHRDIKPGNILLDEDGNPKLADFGIASSRAGEQLTATGAAVGSPYYISPEQASGDGATASSDVYALGVVLYELLTGRKPFEGGTVPAIVIAQVEQEPVPPSAHVEGLDPALDALVLRCLEKNADARFADGGELAEAISRMDSAPPAGVVGAPGGESPTAVYGAAAGASPTAVVGAAEGESPTAVIEPGHDDGAEEAARSSGRRRGAVIAALFGLVLAALVGLAMLGTLGDEPGPGAGPSKRGRDKTPSPAASPGEAGAPADAPAGTGSEGGAGSGDDESPPNGEEDPVENEVPAENEAPAENEDPAEDEPDVDPVPSVEPTVEATVEVPADP